MSYGLVNEVRAITHTINPQGFVLPVVIVNNNNLVDLKPATEVVIDFSESVAGTLPIDRYVFIQTKGKDILITTVEGSEGRYITPDSPYDQTLEFRAVAVDVEGNLSDPVFITHQVLNNLPENHYTPKVPPMANISQSQSVLAGEVFQLSGTGSVEGTSPIVEYRWRQVSGFNSKLVANGEETIQVTAPITRHNQTLVFGLIAVGGDRRKSEEVFTNVEVTAEKKKAARQVETLIYEESPIAVVFDVYHSSEEAQTMELNVITIGTDTPAVLRFNLRGEFEEDQLNTFDYVSVSLGGENYTTYGNPEQLIVDPENPKRLIIKIGAVTELNEGQYPITVKGYNLTYPNGYELNSRARNLLRPISIRRI